MFNADNARKLSESSNEKKEWNWKDSLELQRIENLIKQACKKGHREAYLFSTPSVRVLEKLKNDGYKFSQGVIALVVEW